MDDAHAYRLPAAIDPMTLRRYFNDVPIASAAQALLQAGPADFVFSDVAPTAL